MPFQPFAVQCSTCGSQLRVTDPAVIGTIAACPKCNSMVQVERPGSQVEVGRSGVDSQAITEEAISVGEHSEFDSPPSTTAEGFAGSDSLADESADELAPGLPPDWQSDKTRRSRQIALVVAVSMASLLVAVAVFGWFVRSWGRTEQAQTTGGQQTESLDPNVQASDDASASDGVPSSDDAQSDRQDGEREPLADEAIVTPDAANSQTEASSNQDSDLMPKVAETNSPIVPTDLIPQSPIGRSPIGQSRIDQPPVAPNPVQPPLGTQDANAKENSEASDADDLGGMQDLPPELEKYTKILLGNGAQVAPKLKAPPTMDEVEVEGAAVEDLDDATIPTQIESLNLRADLAIKLALSSEGYPLSDLMLLVSQVTGVPIQIDWVSFDLAGIDIETSVPTKKAWRSAKDLLNETAKAFGAELREEKTVLVLTLSDETFGEAVGNVQDVADFADTRESASLVLKEFLKGNNEGDLRQAMQLAGLATEALRRMRKIEPKIADKRFRRWAQRSGESVDWPVLAGGDAGPQADSPIAMAGLLRRAARRNQATCVVNWFDANRRGATPGRRVIPHGAGDAATTLDSVLSPLGLQVRKVDAGHWWVGTEASYDRLPVVVWTSPLGDSRDLFVQRIEKIMAGASREVYRLVIDEESDRALMLLPRYIVRQLPTITPAIAKK